MPSSKNRKRLEVPTYYYDAIRRIATAEDRTMANVLSELIFSGLQSYRPAWIPGEHLDRLTQRARRVLDLMQAAPAQFNHNYVGTEHLLLGLVEEGDGPAARALAQYGISPEVVRDGITEVIGRGDKPVTDQVGMVPRVRKVLGLAIEEASRLDHNYVGTGHLLLALVGEGGGIAVRILKQRGVAPEDLRGTMLLAVTRGDTPLADM